MSHIDNCKFSLNHLRECTQEKHYVFCKEHTKYFVCENYYQIRSKDFSTKGSDISQNEAWERLVKL